MHIISFVFEEFNIFLFILMETLALTKPGNLLVKKINNISRKLTTDFPLKRFEQKYANEIKLVSFRLERI